MNKYKDGHEVHCCPDCGIETYSFGKCEGEFLCINIKCKTKSFFTPIESDLQTLIDKNHPAKKAWDKYVQTIEYENTRNWALYKEHVDGSLWAAFYKGWESKKQLTQPITGQ